MICSIELKKNYQLKIQAEPHPQTFILIDIVGAIHARSPSAVPDRRRSTMADTRRSLAETVTQKAVLQEAGAGGRGGEGHQKIIWIDFLVCYAYRS